MREFIFCDRWDLYTRDVTKISSCQVNTTSRWGIKQLEISFCSIFLWKYSGAKFIIAGGNSWPPALEDSPDTLKTEGFAQLRQVAMCSALVHCPMLLYSYIVCARWRPQRVILSLGDSFGSSCWVLKSLFFVACNTRLVTAIQQFSYQVLCWGSLFWRTIYAGKSQLAKRLIRLILTQ